MQQLIARNANTKLVLVSHMLSYNSITKYLSVSLSASEKVKNRRPLTTVLASVMHVGNW
jgi:hypothetical protein